MRSKRSRTASSVAPPAAQSCRIIATPRIGSADSVTPRPASPSPGANSPASGPASGTVAIATGIEIATSATANSVGVRRGRRPTRSGAEVTRMLWLKTPKLV